MADNGTEPHAPESNQGTGTGTAGSVSDSERPPIDPGNLVTFQKGVGEFDRRSTRGTEEKHRNRD